jgi:cobalt-zinc-cadmium efflux system outer membrane protein
MQRAALTYSAVRQRVATELRDAMGQRDQAEATLAALRTTILEPLETQVRAAERAFAAGDISYLFVLEMSRRRTDALVRTREAEAEQARALARIERALGARCEPAVEVNSGT